MLKGVIDIGTNSVRLGIQSGKTMQKYVITTRLGQGSAKGQLQPEPMRRTAEAVCSLLQKAAQQGVGEAYVYATAAVREAENSAEFERMLADRGVLLQILPGTKEALIAFAGAANGEGDAVIDIGGGSTEVMVKHMQVRALSRRLGAVRLQERFDGRAGIDESIKRQTEALIAPVIEEYAPLHPEQAQRLIGVSGTPTTLASMKLGLERYSTAVQDTVLELDEIRSMETQLFAPLEQRLCIKGIQTDRADILPFGVIILERFMTRFGFESITVSDRDSLEGFLTQCDAPDFGAKPFDPHSIKA